ncbi:MAG TPA: response regulator transcription factor [Steroidobacteraceae bacterium]|nr:response regulator transcription factor [Steroidobacteraceae bacterium]
MNGGSVRIMLVDDHAIVRAGFRRLLEQHPNLQVVAEAADADRAYALFIEHEPDVIVMDVSMRGVSGLDSIRRIITRRPAARILVFTMHEDASLAERAIQLGARGYVTKSSPPETLATAVSEVAAGKLALSPDIAKSIAIRKLSGQDDSLSLLSPREFEIFRLLASGNPVPEIAKLMNLSVKTIANYHTLIKQKLHLSSDVELVLLAQRQEVI